MALFGSSKPKAGLSLAFLDRRAKLDRTEIVGTISAQVIGQEEAVHAAADVIAVAKARLNDPDRPLAAFLFLGPTGVGKTESAKAVATLPVRRCRPAAALRHERVCEPRIGGSAGRHVFSSPRDC